MGEGTDETPVLCLPNSLRISAKVVAIERVIRRGACNVSVNKPFCTAFRRDRWRAVSRNAGCREGGSISADRTTPLVSSMRNACDFGGFVCANSFESLPYFLVQRSMVGEGNDHVGSSTSKESAKFFIEFLARRQWLQRANRPSLPGELWDRSTNWYFWPPQNEQAFP